MISKIIYFKFLFCNCAGVVRKKGLRLPSPLGGVECCVGTNFCWHVFSEHQHDPLERPLDWASRTYAHRALCEGSATSRVVGLHAATLWLAMAAILRIAVRPCGSLRTTSQMMRGMRSWSGARSRSRSPRCRSRARAPSRTRSARAAR